jgi:hypothetical protein
MENEKIEKIMNRLSGEAVPDDVRKIASEKTKQFMATKADEPKVSLWRMIMKSRITKFAAAAAVIIAVGVLAYNHIGSVDIASVSWATVVNNVQTAKCVSYKYVIEDANGNVEQTVRVMYMSPDCVREESQLGNSKSKIVIRRVNKDLVLYPETKTGTLMEYKDNGVDVPSEVKNNPGFHLWKNFKRDFETAKFVGSERIDGYQADMFIFESKDGIIKSKFWADRQTGLPIRAEIERKAFEGDPMHRESARFIFTEFTWNNLDESLFSMEIPQEYKIKNYTLNTPIPSEQAMVDALGASAELADGNFPAQFEDKPLAKLVGDVCHANNNVGKDEKMAILQKILKIDAGVKFLQTLKKENRDWHYSGDGVKLGNKETPICWWKTDFGLYRVVYGDLSVSDCNSVPNGG